MTRFQTTLLLLVLALGGAYFSNQGLKERPLTFFLLGGDPPEAFRVRASLGNGGTSLEPIPMDRRRSQTANEIMDRRDLGGLRALAAEMGPFQGVLAVQGDDWEGSLSWYLGGGLAQVFRKRPEASFDDLGVLDRIFLTFFLQAPGTPPVSVTSIEVDIPVHIRPALTPMPSPNAIGLPPAGPLRVEIQNGCGIKGAADWAARRLEGPGLKVVGTGNASNFRHAKTSVKTAAGRPVALEEALERMGVPPEAVEEMPTLSGLLLETPKSAQPVDVVVILGKDFKEMKAKKSGKR